MSLDLDRDMDLMLAGPLARDAVLRPGRDNARPLRCLFDEDYYAAAGAPLGLDTAQAVATCKPSEVADAARGDEFTVDGRAFKVGRVSPDGSGWAAVVLREAKA